MWITGNICSPYQRFTVWHCEKACIVLLCKKKRHACLATLIKKHSSVLHKHSGFNQFKIHPSLHLITPEKFGRCWQNTMRQKLNAKKKMLKRIMNKGGLIQFYLVLFIYCQITTDIISRSNHSVALILIYDPRAQRKDNSILYLFPPISFFVFLWFLDTSLW